MDKIEVLLISCLVGMLILGIWNQDYLHKKRLAQMNRSIYEALIEKELVTLEREYSMNYVSEKEYKRDKEFWLGQFKMETEND